MITMKILFPITCFRKKLALLESIKGSPSSYFWLWTMILVISRPWNEQNHQIRDTTNIIVPTAKTIICRTLQPKKTTTTCTKLIILVTKKKEFGGLELHYAKELGEQCQEHETKLSKLVN